APAERVRLLRRRTPEVRARVSRTDPAHHRRQRDAGGAACEAQPHGGLQVAPAAPARSQAVQEREAAAVACRFSVPGCTKLSCCRDTRVSLSTRCNTRPSCVTLLSISDGARALAHYVPSGAATGIHL